MDFKDLKLTDEKTLSFIPTSIRYVFVDFLKQHNPNGVTYTVIPWRKIETDTTLKDKYRPYQKMAKAAFEKCGYEPSSEKAYDGFISNIEPQYLFEKLKAFYGKSIDADVKAWHENAIESVNETETHAENQTESVTLNITDPTINIIGSFEELVELDRLMQEKELTDNDLKTILVAVQLNEI